MVKKYSLLLNIITILNSVKLKLLYTNCPKRQPLAAKLTKIPYIELISIEDKLESEFYKKQCLVGNWSVRDLRRQIKSNFYYRKRATLSHQLGWTNTIKLLKRKFYITYKNSVTLSRNLSYKKHIKLIKIINIKKMQTLSAELTNTSYIEYTNLGAKL